MITAPFSPTLARPWGGHQDAQGYELKRAAVWNISAVSITSAMGTGTGSGNVPDGMLAFRTTVSQRRLNFTDAGSDVLVPRLDYAESVTARWAFTSSGSPFTVSSNTLVTNLNADLLDGANTSENADATTVALRTSAGRLKAADPVSGTDVVNYQSMVSYVSGVVRPKAAAKYATTAALPAFTASGVTPKRLTANVNGALSVDSNTPAVNDRIGVVYETSTNAKYNGIYVVVQVGDGSNPWILDRASDVDESSEVVSGTQFWVTSGTVNGGSSWLLVTADPITLNTTDLSFIQNGGTQNITASNGLNKVGNEVYVKLTTAANPGSKPGFTYTAGAMIWADSTSTLDQKIITGLVKCNGSSGPAAVGSLTANVLPRYSSSDPFLVDSALTDDGSVVTSSRTVRPTASGKDLGSSSVPWNNAYTTTLSTYAGTGASKTDHILMRSSGLRWSSGFIDTESGSNAGSNWYLYRYDDVGAFLGSAIGITRSTGLVTVGASLTVTTNLTVSSFTSGSVIFAGSSGLLSQDNSKFFWDNSTKALGLGLTTPLFPLHILAAGTLVGGVYYSMAGVADSSRTYSAFPEAAIDFRGKYNSGGSYYPFAAVGGGKENTSDGDTSGFLRFFTTTSGGTPTERGRITSAGNFVLGGSTASARLHVLSTSEQLRLGYDAANRSSFTVGAAGDTTWTTTGTANITLTPGGTVRATYLTTGSVVFAKASGEIAQNNANFFWDNSNVRLGIGTATPSVPLDVVSASAQLRLRYSTNSLTFSVGSDGGLSLLSSMSAATASHTVCIAAQTATSSTVSVSLIGLYGYSVGVNSGVNASNIGVQGQATLADYCYGGYFTASQAQTRSVGVQVLTQRVTAGSETSVYGVDSEVQIINEGAACPGIGVRSVVFASTAFSTLFGFRFTPSFASAPSGTSVYGAYLDSIISGATVTTNTACYLNATGGVTNYALYVQAGTINFQTMTASTLLQVDASKNLISSNDIPAAVTIGGKAITRKVTGNITWALASGRYQCDITHGLGTDAVSVEVYDGSSSKQTWLFDVLRPSSGVVRVIADADLGSGYTYIILG